MKALLAAVALLLLPLNQETKPDLSSPEATLKSFFTAFSKGDFVLAAKHLHDVKPSSRLQELAEAMKPGMPSFEVLSCTVASAGENRVTLTVKIAASSRGKRREEGQESKIDAVKVGDEWKLVVPPNANLATADMLASVTGFIANPDEIFVNAKKAALRTACLSNIKQIALGAHLYLFDHDDKLKVTGANVQQKLGPYLKNSGLWTCPLHSAGTVSYSINGNVAGKSIEDIDRPAETVMFYEGKNGALEFRHDGFAVVAFVDGHAKAMNRESAKKLVWTAKAP